MAVVVIHQRFRNEEHCPTCRVWYIAAFPSMDSALQGTFPDDPDLAETLRNNRTVWIDEWIRRRNGDRYTLIPFILDQEVKLPVFLHDNLESCISLPDKLWLKVLFHIRKDLSCPENIKYRITFHEGSGCEVIGEKRDEERYLCDVPVPSCCWTNINELCPLLSPAAWR